MPDRRDRATAAVLVLPEIQVWSSANRFRRHATTDLHGSGIRLTLLKVNAPGPPGRRGWPHPSTSTGNVHGGPAPSDGRWTSSLGPPPRAWGETRARWRAGSFRWALDVLLVSLTADVGEISALLASAGHRIVETIVQRRDRPDSRTFVGRGKLDEVQARVDAGGIDAVVFNGELRPTMHYQLERDLGVECYDRLRVLLELFAQRASSREGELQVELALLADERVLVDDRMFSTLATTTRSLTGTRKRILLTDTIGFVDGVPFWMVEAFNATLEEILQADLVLLLVDVSDSEDEIRRKVRLAARTLFPKVSADSVRPVLTKADLLPEIQIAAKAQVLAESEFHRTPIAISAPTGRGLVELRDIIARAFAYPIEVHLVLVQDAEAGGKLHWLYEHTEVVSAVHRPDRIEVVVRCRPRDRESVERLGRVLLARTLE